MQKWPRGGTRSVFGLPHSFHRTPPACHTAEMDAARCALTSMSTFTLPRRARSCRLQGGGGCCVWRLQGEGAMFGCCKEMLLCLAVARRGCCVWWLQGASTGYKVGVISTFLFPCNLETIIQNIINQIKQNASVTNTCKLTHAK